MEDLPALRVDEYGAQAHEIRQVFLSLSLILFLPYKIALSSCVSARYRPYALLFGTRRCFQSIQGAH